MPTCKVATNGDGAFKGAIDEFGSALVDISQELPDHSWLVEEHLVCDEGIERTATPV